MQTPQDHMSPVPEVSIEDRLTEEITSLSTKLVTSVSKQGELEEKLFQYHKENHQLKTKLSNLTDYETKYIELLAVHQELNKKYIEGDKAKNDALAENKKLSAEVEELTASLFDEANKMVSNASRETHNFKVKNMKLYEELDEKDNIISSLQSELIDLKKMLESNPGPGPSPSNISEEEQTYFNSSLFSPKIKAIRYDTSAYIEFKEFITLITSPGFQFDLNSLKLSVFFKKVWIDEIEKSITVPSTNFLNRWQKGKYFWNLVVEGKITIEPVKGINETLKLDYSHGNNNLPVPTALKEPCEFCQESRDDNLEHSRLHIVKLSNPDNISESVNYAICNYCLIKLRNICEFFAKLRLINKNFYKLNDNEEYKVLKLYLILLVIRSKIFWSKIGYWDNSNEINMINIDEIDLDHFKMLLAPMNGSNDDLSAVNTNDTNHSISQITDKSDIPITEKVLPDKSFNQQSLDNEKDSSEKLGSLDDPIDISSEKSSPGTNKVADLINSFEIDASHTDDEFADTVEEIPIATITRKDSKSKKFKEQINKGLDDTMLSLEESFKEDT